MLKNKHILIIRLSAMGDVAMTVPVLRAFVAQHPTVRITVVSKGFLQPLFQDIPNVSFFTAEVNGKHKGILGLYRLFKELQDTGITHVADLHNVLRSKIVRFFFRFLGIPVAYIDKGRREKKALTRTNNKIFKQLKTSHERYAAVFNNLGFSVDISNPKPIEKNKLSKEIITITGEKKQPWIGIAPFAAFNSKIYPLDLLESVIAELSAKNYTLFLFGGKADIPTLENIEKKYPNTINVAGKIGGLQNEIQLIIHLDIMLSMDSGNAHLAAMQGVKTITIWGGTHPYAGFAPFNQPNDYCLLPDLEKFPNLPCSIYGNKTCKGYEDAMRSILPETIVNKIESIIKTKSAT